MKKTDIAMIILIASLGILIAYFVAINLSFLKLPERGVKVQTIQKITSDIQSPDETVFNKGAINPTVEVVVGSAGS